MATRSLGARRDYFVVYNFQVELPLRSIVSGMDETHES